MLAEFFAIKFNEPVAMTVFLGEHLFENCGRGRSVRLQSLREVAVNSGVFFFEGNGQGQNLLFAKALKRSHVWLSQVRREIQKIYGEEGGCNCVHPSHVGDVGAASGAPYLADGV